jgi:ATP-dependent Clp protease ATP-binding subunit ClpA
MFERFTDRARRVLVLAQEEARLLNHNYLGTEHILLGLVHEGEGVAALVLDSFGVGLDTVRQRIKEAVGDSPGAGVGAPPFTPRSKKVLELSLREALRLGHNYIGTEHLLLGLVRVDEGLAAQILTQLGVPSTDAVRDRVTTVLREHGQTPTTPGFTPAGATVRDRARMLASAEGSGDARVPAGSHHYLLALLADATSLASGVLVGLGVTEDAVRQKIAELGTAGTSDEVTTMPTPITVEIAPGVSISADDPKQLEGVDLDELRRRITGTPP